MTARQFVGCAMTATMAVAFWCGFAQSEENAPGTTSRPPAKATPPSSNPESRAAEVTLRVATHLDIPYAKRAGTRKNLLSLDIYRPVPVRPRSSTSLGQSTYPVLVMIHGGGWRMGDKKNDSIVRYKVPYFVTRGYVYISINYRLSRDPRVKHPDHINDVALAMAWVHNHVAKYGGDPNRLFVMGHSAGAHLAALIATDHRKLEKLGKSLRIIKGVICLDGAGYDVPAQMNSTNIGPLLRLLYRGAFGNNEKGWIDASPRFHVAKGKGIAPTLVFYTARAPAKRASKNFVRALTAAGVPAHVVRAADKSHSEINRCIGQRGDPYTKIIMRFLNEPHKVAGMAHAQSSRPVSPSNGSPHKGG